MILPGLICSTVIRSYSLGGGGGGGGEGILFMRSCGNTVHFVLHNYVALKVHSCFANFLLLCQLMLLHSGYV